MINQEQVFNQMQSKGRIAFDKREASLLRNGSISESAAITTLLGKVIMKGGKDSFYNAVCDLCETESRANAKPETALAKSVYGAIDPLVIAVITAKMVINAASGNSNILTVTKSLGKAILIEAKFQAFSKVNKSGLMKTAEAFAQEPIHVQRKVLLRRVSVVPDWLEDHEAMFRVGGFLVNAFILRTGLIEKITTRKGVKTSLTLGLTDEARETIETMNAYLRLHSIWYLPLVEKPDPWVVTDQGAYDKEWFKSFFLRGNVSQHHKDFYSRPEISKGLAKSFQAVNLLQETPYRINRKVLEALDTIYKQHMDDNDCPLWHNYGVVMFENITDGTELLEGRDRAERVRENQAKKLANHSARSKRLAIANTIIIGKKYIHNPELYFAHNVDFRGRMYPFTTGLSTQGADFQKAVLEYADTFPIGNELGPFWLAVHTANCFGVGNLTLSERRDWVVANEAFLKAVVADPLGSLSQWGSADAPLQFLAASFEWVGYLREGSTFKTRLPIAQDGSCNGLQHYAALLRSEPLADAVNLNPSERVKDVYQVVADKLKVLVEQTVARLSEKEHLYRTYLESRTDKHEDKKDAERYFTYKWLLEQGLLDRKLAKHPTMTLVYGVTSRGIRNQVAKHVEKTMLQKGIETPPELATANVMYQYIGDALEEALAGAIGDAYHTMNWLRKVASALHKKHKYMRWHIPTTGFTVLNVYFKAQTREVDIYSEGGHKTFRCWVGDDKPNAQKQAVAAPPNFIHSLDAAHLMATCTGLGGLGIKSITAIHDSYGVPAPHVEEMNRMIREKFVELYKTDFIQVLVDQVKEELTDEEFQEFIQKNPTPVKGAFDLDKVKNSTYFFA